MIELTAWLALLGVGAYWAETGKGGDLTFWSLAALSGSLILLVLTGGPAP